MSKDILIFGPAVLWPESGGTIEIRWRREFGWIEHGIRQTELQHPGPRIIIFTHGPHPLYPVEYFTGVKILC